MKDGNDFISYLTRQLLYLDWHIKVRATVGSICWNNDSFIDFFSYKGKISNSLASSFSFGSSFYSFNAPRHRLTSSSCDEVWHNSFIQWCCASFRVKFWLAILCWFLNTIVIVQSVNKRVSWWRIFWISSLLKHTKNLKRELLHGRQRYNSIVYLWFFLWTFSISHFEITKRNLTFICSFFGWTEGRGS